MANVAPQLQEAYDLIESGDLQSARQLLDDIRTDNENNPDFWWIYAHAIENQNEGVSALERVRQLAPNYPGLQGLSETIGLSTPQPQRVQSLRPSVPPPSTADIDEFYGDEDEFDSESSRERSGSGLMPFLLISGLIVVVIIVVLFLLSSLSSNNTTIVDVTTTPTSVLSVPDTAIPTTDSQIVGATDVTDTITVEPTEQPTDIPVDTDEPPTEEPTGMPVDTDEPPTEEPTDTPEPENIDPFIEIYETLETSGVPQDGIVMGATSTFGDSYLVTVCSAVGPVATANILSIMDDLQTVADNLDTTVEGLAFAITDCSNETVRLTLGIDRATADNYWAGEIGQIELQQSLQRVN